EKVRRTRFHAPHRGVSKSRGRVYCLVRTKVLRCGATDLLSLPNKPYSLRLADPKFKPLNASQPIEYVKKKLLFDFQNLDLPSQGLAWNQLPEKWEGLALLSDNRLLVISDNDFLTPELNLSGKKIPFPKCQTPIPTGLFTIQLP
ncbi:MAG: esterase-like activity of phytase family protein, partial [Verrucomicrobia bacterium]|nr:esterase-like activity of phytase family protein [Verrucomicrobiota bacterium]